MSFSGAVSSVLRQYASFTGRASRPEYWWWTLATAIAYIAAFILALAAKPLLILGALLYLAMLLPTLAVTVRRLHDTDRSGWAVLLGAIPLVGGIVLLVLTVQPGTPGPNRYGIEGGYVSESMNEGHDSDRAAFSALVGHHIATSVPDEPRNSVAAAAGILVAILLLAGEFALAAS